MTESEIKQKVMEGYDLIRKDIGWQLIKFGCTELSLSYSVDDLVIEELQRDGKIRVTMGKTQSRAIFLVV